MSWLQSLHLAGFGFAVLGCVLGLWRAREITHAETRYGLYGLFIASGLWAGAYLVTFLTSSLTLASAAYEVGLLAGLATVGSWLYFCSAYAGETYHRQPVYRVLALVTFLSISAVKLTNPVHGLYFSIEMVETPFPHASVTLFGAHWAVTVLAYALSAIGFYMLLQLFIDSHISTTNLAALVGIMAVPAGVNALSALGAPGLVAQNYEPIAVAVFALGTLYVIEDTFDKVRWTGQQQVFDEITEAIVLVDEDGRIYQYNAAAEALFPSISLNETIETILPGGTRSEDEMTSPEWNKDGDLRTLNVVGTTHYYLLRETELTIGPHQVGRAVVFSDVTQIENQRRELKRQSTQLEGVAAAVAHELRNSLTIIESHTQLVAESLERGEIESAPDRIKRISDAADRMSSVVSDLTTMLQLGGPITETSPISLQSAVDAACVRVDSADITTTVRGDGDIQADSTVFIELLQSAVRLAGETDATAVDFSMKPESFTIRMNGNSLDDSDTEALFEYGTAVPHSDAGMLGPNIKSFSEGHGWSVAASTPEEGGILLTFSGVTIENRASNVSE